MFLPISSLYEYTQIPISSTYADSRLNIYIYIYNHYITECLRCAIKNFALHMYVGERLLKSLMVQIFQ